jgi:hypothetical protein
VPATAATGQRRQPPQRHGVLLGGSRHVGRPWDEEGHGRRPRRRRLAPLRTRRVQACADRRSHRATRARPHRRRPLAGRPRLVPHRGAATPPGSVAVTIQAADAAGVAPLVFHAPGSPLASATPPGSSSPVSRPARSPGSWTSPRPPSRTTSRPCSTGWASTANASSSPASSAGTCDGACGLPIRSAVDRAPRVATRRDRRSPAGEPWLRTRTRDRGRRRVRTPGGGSGALDCRTARRSSRPAWRHRASRRPGGGASTPSTG